MAPRTDRAPVAPLQDLTSYFALVAGYAARITFAMAESAGSIAAPLRHTSAIVRFACGAASGRAWSFARASSVSSERDHLHRLGEARRAKLALVHARATARLERLLAEAVPVVQEQQLLAAELTPITPREQTAALSAALGALLRFVEVTREQAAAAMRAFIPEDLVEATLDISGTPAAIEQRVSPDVERVLGRPAASFAAWAERNAGAFR